MQLLTKHLRYCAVRLHYCTVQPGQRHRSDAQPSHHHIAAATSGAVTCYMLLASKPSPRRTYTYFRKRIMEAGTDIAACTACMYMYLTNTYLPCCSRRGLECHYSLKRKPGPRTKDIHQLELQQAVVAKAASAQRKAMETVTTSLDDQSTADVLQQVQQQTAAAAAAAASTTTSGKGKRGRQSGSGSGARSARRKSAAREASGERLRLRRSDSISSNSSRDSSDAGGGGGGGGHESSDGSNSDVSTKEAPPKLYSMTPSIVPIAPMPSLSSSSHALRKGAESAAALEQAARAMHRTASYSTIVDPYSALTISAAGASGVGGGEHYHAQGAGAAAAAAAAVGTSSSAPSSSEPSHLMSAFGGGGGGGSSGGMASMAVKMDPTGRTRRHTIHTSGGGSSAAFGSSGGSSRAFGTSALLPTPWQQRGSSGPAGAAAAAPESSSFRLKSVPPLDSGSSGSSGGAAAKMEPHAADDVPSMLLPHDDVDLLGLFDTQVPEFGRESGFMSPLGGSGHGMMMDHSLGGSGHSIGSSSGGVIGGVDRGVERGNIWHVPAGGGDSGSMRSLIKRSSGSSIKLRRRSLGAAPAISSADDGGVRDPLEAFVRKADPAELAEWVQAQRQAVETDLRAVSPRHDNKHTKPSKHGGGSDSTWGQQAWGDGFASNGIGGSGRENGGGEKHGVRHPAAPNQRQAGNRPHISPDYHKQEREEMDTRARRRGKHIDDDDDATGMASAHSPMPAGSARGGGAAAAAKDDMAAAERIQVAYRYWQRRKDRDAKRHACMARSPMRTVQEQASISNNLQGKLCIVRNADAAAVKAENDALRKELSQFDLAFFEEVEDLKFAYQRLKQSVRLDSSVHGASNETWAHALETAHRSVDWTAARAVQTSIKTSTREARSFDDFDSFKSSWDRASRAEKPSRGAKADQLWRKWTQRQVDVAAGGFQAEGDGAEACDNPSEECTGGNDNSSGTVNPHKRRPRQGQQQQGIGGAYQRKLEWEHLCCPAGTSNSKLVKISSLLEQLRAIATDQEWYPAYIRDRLVAAQASNLKPSEPPCGRRPLVSFGKAGGTAYSSRDDANAPAATVRAPPQQSPPRHTYGRATPLPFKSDTPLSAHGGYGGISTARQSAFFSEPAWDTHLKLKQGGASGSSRRDGAAAASSTERGHTSTPHLGLHRAPETALGFDVPAAACGVLRDIAEQLYLTDVDAIVGSAGPRGQGLFDAVAATFRRRDTLLTRVLPATEIGLGLEDLGVFVDARHVRQVAHWLSSADGADSDDDSVDREVRQVAWSSAGSRPSWVSSLKRLFDSLCEPGQNDVTDGDGIMALCEQLGLDVSAQEGRALAEVVGGNGSGVVDFATFLEFFDEQDSADSDDGDNSFHDHETRAELPWYEQEPEIAERLSLRCGLEAGGVHLSADDHKRLFKALQRSSSAQLVSPSALLSHVQHHINSVHQSSPQKAQASAAHISKGFSHTPTTSTPLRYRPATTSQHDHTSSTSDNGNRAVATASLSVRGHAAQRTAAVRPPHAAASLSSAASPGLSGADDYFKYDFKYDKQTRTRASLRPVVEAEDDPGELLRARKRAGKSLTLDVADTSSHSRFPQWMCLASDADSNKHYGKKRALVVHVRGGRMELLLRSSSAPAARSSAHPRATPACTPDTRSGSGSGFKTNPVGGDAGGSNGGTSAVAPPPPIAALTQARPDLSLRIRVALRAAGAAPAEAVTFLCFGELRSTADVAAEQMAPPVIPESTAWTHRQHPVQRDRMAAAGASPTDGDGNVLEDLNMVTRTERELVELLAKALEGTKSMTAAESMKLMGSLDPTGSGKVSYRALLALVMDHMEHWEQRYPEIASDLKWQLSQLSTSPHATVDNLARRLAITADAGAGDSPVQTSSSTRATDKHQRVTSEDLQRCLQGVGLGLTDEQAHHLRDLRPDGLVSVRRLLDFLTTAAVTAAGHIGQEQGSSGSKAHRLSLTENDRDDMSVHDSASSDELAASSSSEAVGTPEPSLATEFRAAVWALQSSLTLDDLTNASDRQVEGLESSTCHDAASSQRNFLQHVFTRRLDGDGDGYFTASDLAAAMPGVGMDTARATEARVLLGAMDMRRRGLGQLSFADFCRFMLADSL
ncbi:hypothetical protein JKP88DRAFT_266360 [Tribonema minus]|uniref:EF-hand domain-containing protein n=1 Tax=Tribonema minus TaxID=303371 RepID=A0A835ZFR5_9STRA|nr:hypothetical protein JKP88DRAFT_266360 [Tribonema minus]